MVASAECKAGSDKEEGEVRAEGFDGVSTSIAYPQFVGTNMGLDRRRSILLSIRRLRPHRKEKNSLLSLRDVPHGRDSLVLYIRVLAEAPNHDTGRPWSDPEQMFHNLVALM